MNLANSANSEKGTEEGEAEDKEEEEEELHWVDHQVKTIQIIVLFRTCVIESLKTKAKRGTITKYCACAQKYSGDHIS